jgi:hypothetical protein
MNERLEVSSTMSETMSQAQELVQGSEQEARKGIVVYIYISLWDM